MKANPVKVVSMGSVLSKALSQLVRCVSTTSSRHSAGSRTACSHHAALGPLPPLVCPN